MVAYVFLRRVEHRLQMIADEQWSASPEQQAVERLACFWRHESCAASLATCLAI